MEKLDQTLNLKLEEASEIIEENKNKSLIKVNEQIHEITKLTLSKITNIQINEDDIKDVVDNIQRKAVN